MSAIQTPDFSPNRNGLGKLMITLADGTVHEGVVPACAFPIPAADEGLSLMSVNGRELIQITQSDALPTLMRALVEAELGTQEFMSGIRTIAGASTYAAFSTWTVQTNRGQTDLMLRGEKDIRRLTGITLLISDSRDIHYLICGLLALDKHSRKILDRFL